MANPEHLAKLGEGVAAWNRWRRQEPSFRPSLEAADLRGADLSKFNLSMAAFGGAKLPNANLRGAKLNWASLRGADLRRANLSGADLRTANLGNADLSDAKLCGAALVGANLDGARLSMAVLTKTDFSRARLAGAKLDSADLYGADLRGAELNGADLSNTNLNRASFLRAMLYGADLRGANLFRTDLLRAELDGANFAGATVGNTVFADVDLEKAKGLEAVRHLCPSIVSIDTIYKSKGKIPHGFLRGAGVPINFIEYMDSMVGSGIEFYSLFISYSTHDQKFADRLCADLQAKGVRCWFARHDMRGGRKIHEQIDEAIRMYDKLLLILSPASMESEWVRTEIAIARKREKEQKKAVLFPIALCPFKKIKEWEYFDAGIGKDSAREIREYHIPNFTRWKTDQDAYQREFDRLLKALNEKPTPAAD